VCTARIDAPGKVNISLSYTLPLIEEVTPCINGRVGENKPPAQITTLIIFSYCFVY
jgi:hypothetical protein